MSIDINKFIGAAYKLSSESNFKVLKEATSLPFYLSIDFEVILFET